MIFINPDFCNANSGHKPGTAKKVPSTGNGVTVDPSPAGEGISLFHSGTIRRPRYGSIRLRGIEIPKGVAWVLPWFGMACVQIHLRIIRLCI